MTASTVRCFGPLELFVGNAKHAAAFFDRVLGFTVLEGPLPSDAGDRVSYRLGQGDATLILTGALTPDSPVARFVQRHGDGVGGVDFAVDDELDLRLEPLVGAAEIAHGFVTGGRDAPAPHGVGIVGLDHLAISVAPGTRDQWVRHYEQQLGFVRVGDDEHIDLDGSVFDMASIHARPGVHGSTDDARLVFAEPAPGPRRSQIEQHLLDNDGPGVHHIAFATDDILASTLALQTRGVRTLPIPSEYFDAARERVAGADVPWDDLERIGVLVDRDDHGLLFQVFTETITDRNTVYLELIQRVGAAGFGHDNIRALYSGVVAELDEPARG